MVDHMGWLGICVVRDWPIATECFPMDMFFDSHNSGSLGAAKTLGLGDNWQTTTKEKKLVILVRSAIHEDGSGPVLYRFTL